MTETVDLAVIGAGPAGMAAATLAAEHGLDVVVYDDNAEPGGQIYRAVETVARDRAKDFAFLGESYRAGAELTRAFRASRARYEPGTTVWLVQKDRTIGISRDGKARMVAAKRILIATGALERPVPIPGWTLPGVMSVGAAQSVLKSAALAPKQPVVLAGKGPLLFLVAAQYVAAGVKIAAILETGARKWDALPHLWQAWSKTNYIGKGLELIRAIERAGVTVVRNAVSDLKAIGRERVEAVTFSADGSPGRIETALLLLHEGVISNVQLTMAIPVKHAWNATQRCWQPVLDARGNTDVDGIAVAGDSGGIAGAEAAAHMGRIAALDALRAFGRIDGPTFAAMIVVEEVAQKRLLAARPFLDALYPPPDTAAAIADDTIVCRCEEVTAGDIRKAVDLGCTGPNQTKSFTRAGMGPCQGRMCGLTVAEIIAAKLNRPMEEIGYYRIRPPIKPLTVGELAALE
ncbi:MAG: FAD-binding protein [Alphaproteobacteria bacterium]|nr:FAD-binding protein [Alphaproteobacteria bacterium]